MSRSLPLSMPRALAACRLDRYDLPLPGLCYLMDVTYNCQRPRGALSGFTRNQKGS